MNCIRDAFFGKYFYEIAFIVLKEDVVMNCIRDIDGRNEKSGGRVSFIGLGT